MNAYHDKYLRLQTIEGAKDVQDYCEWRRCRCHIDGLPDCPFIGCYDTKYAYKFCMLESIPIHWDVK